MQQGPPSHGMFTRYHLHTKGSLTTVIVITVVRQDTRQLSADSEKHNVMHAARQATSSQYVGVFRRH